MSEPPLSQLPHGTRGTAVRLFLTAWLVFALHFATDVVREIYPAISLGESLSFRVDEYANLHPDLFEKEGYGWHIGNNPGASMVAAVPYAFFAPLVNHLAERVQVSRAEQGLEEPPAFDTPRRNARRFYAEAWKRGLDVKLGLAAMIMQVLCMAPSTAAGVVLVFYLLRHITGNDRAALWLALLYAFGTPAFFRTGFLNHNLMIGHMTLLGFALIWNPGQLVRWSEKTRWLIAGVMGGATLLFDYSGVITLLALFGYLLLKGFLAGGFGFAVRRGIWYVYGTLPPVLLLWWYQWRSFGHPLYPGQHWMPPVKWIERGYQGYGPPQLELLRSLVIEPQFGLFVSAPVLLLALVYVARRSPGAQLPRLEAVFLVAIFAALWVFFSGSNYTRLQFNTGVRYMAPAIPLLYVPAAAMLSRLRPLPVYLIGTASVVLAWCMAMSRTVAGPLGVLHSVVDIFTGGLRLPALTTLERLSGGIFGNLPEGRLSPLPILLLAAALLFALWSPRFARQQRQTR